MSSSLSGRRSSKTSRKKTHLLHLWQMSFCKTPNPPTTTRKPYTLQRQLLPLGATIKDDGEILHHGIFVLSRGHTKGKRRRSYVARQPWIREFHGSRDLSMGRSTPSMGALHPFHRRKGPHLGPSLHGISLQSKEFPSLSVE